MMGNLLLTLITFLSAFLLFQIELIIAKIFLPNYGGSYLVWGACIVFFQAVLLLGYWFAHSMIRRAGIERYRFIHLALLAAPLLFFHGRNLEVVFGNGTLPLVADVFLRLALNIGLVFFVLSTISLVTQAWLVRSKLSSKVNPYALYAVSNLGSFAALLSYPFIVERLLDVHQQLFIWRIGYFVLIVLNVLAYFQVTLAAANKENRIPVKQGPTDKRKIIQWLLLGAGGSMIFLSVNNLITYDLPPVPVFWIFPLSIYLITYVLNFKKNPWCPSWVAGNVHVTIGFAILYYLIVPRLYLPTLVQFSILLYLLFALCMYCQNALIRSKPAHEDDLTKFYFIISLGSFLGGIFTTWVVPIISSSMIEFTLSLIVIGFAASFDPLRPSLSSYAVRLTVYFVMFVRFWTLCFLEYNFFGIVILTGVTFLIFRELSKTRFAVILTLIFLMMANSVFETERPFSGVSSVQTWKLRNYYGIYKVISSATTKCLMHGSTLHGAQSLLPQNELEPLTYFGRRAAVGEIMQSDFLHFKNVALIGLGVGTCSVYLDRNQSLDILELDPDVYKIATERFTFLKHCLAKTRIFIGDARRSFEKIKDPIYDLIILDAFGGDAIPVHLLTKEAFEMYRTHLNPNGVILIHVSNRYVTLSPVLGRVAHELGAKLCRKAFEGRGLITSSEWLVLTWDEEIYSNIVARYKWTEVKEDAYRGVRAWTDSYSTILPFVRFDILAESLKNFKFFN